jgi:hypothetical protein
VAGKLSINLTDSGGALQLRSSTNGLIDPVPVDSVSWSSQADGDIQNVPTSSQDKEAAYYRVADGTLPPTYGWQLADVHVDDTGAANLCQLDVMVSGSVKPVLSLPQFHLLPGDQPPATIISLASTGAPASGAAAPGIPAADTGLKAPQLNELLPNPTGSGTDSTDEFIELYNSNDVTFDLSGFMLESGTTTKHKFTFPAGTVLKPKSFTAFYATATGLALSNSGGQVQLLDPLGNVISQTDAYSTAKDGEAWALADGIWYWTLKPTPNEQNAVDQTDSAAGSTAASTSSSTRSGTVQGATTGSSGDSATATGNVADVAQVTPIHPWTLALVVFLALLYGLYEYRHDVANRLYQLRKYREARRISRQ